MILLDSILDGKNTSLGEGAILALVAIVLVFLILGIIILITAGVNKLVSKFEKKAESKDTKLLETDNDAMVASLVASIDYQNETKKDVKVVNVKEIK